ncbi:unnamed protein product [Tenebrio molitor]|nr:unnamed protein product [Tenebrio molitor]
MFQQIMYNNNNNNDCCCANRLEILMLTFNVKQRGR